MLQRHPRLIALVTLLVLALVAAGGGYGFSPGWKW
jgi:hypothetical protein